MEIEPSKGWLTVWPRIGIRFDLPDGAAPVDGAEWFGLGPLESYPDSLRAARTGRFSSTIGDLSVDYARPQETGHRSRLRQLTLTSAGTQGATHRDTAGHARTSPRLHAQPPHPAADRTGRTPVRASGVGDESPDRRRGPARARLTGLRAGCVARVRASPRGSHDQASHCSRLVTRSAVFAVAAGEQAEPYAARSPVARRRPPSGAPSPAVDRDAHRGSPRARCGLACGQDVMTICQDKVLP